MSHALLKISPLVCALGLAACGGGSDDSTNTIVKSNGPSTAISAENQQAVATEVTSNSLQFSGNAMSNLTAAVGVASTETESEIINMQTEVLAIRDHMRQHAHATSPQAVAAVVTDEDNCDISGTMTASFDDKNGNNTWDVNESGTITFTNCLFQSGGLTLNGSVKDDFTFEDKTTTTDKFTFSGLKAAKGVLSSEIVSGAITLNQVTAVVAPAINTTNRMVTEDLKVKVSQGSKSENFTLNEDVSFASSTSTPNQQTITGKGTISSDNANINGKVSFEITTAIVVNTTTPVTVTAGQMTISGINGTALYVSFATPDTGSATLQLNVNGANVGNPKVVPVATMLAGLTATAE